MGGTQFFAAFFSYLTVGVILLGAAPTGAQPRLRVQAPSGITLHWTREPALSIELSDDRNQPLPFQPLTLRWPETHPGHARRVVTDSAGQALIQLRGGVLRDEVHVDFDGDAFHLPTTASIDLSTPTEPQRLRWLSPDSSLDLSAPAQRLVAQLEATSTATELSGRSATLTLLPERTELALTTSDSQGRLVFTVPSAELPLGPFQVAIHVSPRGHEPAVRTLHTLNAHLPTSLQARATWAAAGEIHVTGLLKTPRSAAPSRTVRLRRGERVIAETTTDPRGGFMISLSREVWKAAQGAPSLRMHFESTESGLRSATSEPLHLELHRQISSEAFWPWVLSCLCLVGLLLARWRSRQPKSALTASEPRSDGPVDSGSEPRSGQPVFPGVRGTIRDAHTGQPIAAAHVQLIQGEVPWTSVETTTAGGFFCAAPPPGSYRVAIRANGYLPQERMVTVQEPSAAVLLNVALTSTRVLVWQAFKPLASRVPTDGIQGRIATPAEVFRWGQHLCHMPLQNLSTAAEQTLFGRGAPSPENASRLQRALQQVAVKASDPERKQT